MQLNCSYYYRRWQERSSNSVPRNMDHLMAWLYPPPTSGLEVQLPPTEGPWLPPSILKRKGQRDQLRDSIIDLIVKKALSLLNKLTPTSFDKLAPKFVALPMRDDDERISRVLAILFEKAISEPLYIPIYVRLFRIITQTEVGETGRKVLKGVLDRCQREFHERAAFQEEVKVVAQKLAEVRSGSANQKILDDLTLELEDLKYFGRRRSLGNIRFLGELYKLNMLTLRIMVEVVHSLLVPPPPGEEDDYEYLCLLLKMVGQRLDLHLEVLTAHGAGSESTFLPERDWMSKIFSILERLSKSGKLSPRIRFKIMDLVELRQNDWKPRTDVIDDGPTPIMIEGVTITSITITTPTKGKKKRRDGSGTGTGSKSQEELLATQIKEAAGNLLSLTQRPKVKQSAKLRIIRQIRECAEKMESMVMSVKEDDINENDEEVDEIDE